MRNINFYIQANLRDLEHIYYCSRAPPCTTFGASRALSLALSLTKDALPTLPASAASAIVSTAAFVACCLCCCLCPSVLLVPNSATD